jgi:hypothetical protein
VRQAFLRKRVAIAVVVCEEGTAMGTGQAVNPTHVSADGTAIETQEMEEREQFTVSAVGLETMRREGNEPG